MRISLRSLLICGVVSFLPVPLPAQAPSDPSLGQINPFDFQQGQWVVAGKVVTLRGDPISGAKVSVKPSAVGKFEYLKTDLRGEFLAQFWFVVDAARDLSATVEVEKRGFLKAHVVIEMDSAEKARRYPFTLREAQEDSRVLSQADLVSSLAPRFKEAPASDGLSAAGKKDYARGIEEFLDQRRPDRALAPFTKALRADPACLSCRTMLGLAQIDSGDWGGAERNFIEAIKAIRADESKGRAEPLVAYGVMESWRQEPDKAASFLQEALKYSPQDPLALQEMGRAQVLLQNWASADAYLQKALKAGAGPQARLLRAEALLGQGSSDAANQEMTSFLDGREVKTQPVHVRLLWAQIKDRKKVEVTYAKVPPKAGEDIDYLRHPPADLKGLEPAQDQAPLPGILSALGKNVEEFFRNFPNTTSLEEVQQQKLSHKGKVGENRREKFRYLCFAPVEAGTPGFSEYRLTIAADLGPPATTREGFMLTDGFASSSILFHPVHQSGSTFRYLGRQELNGRETLVIAFAQNPAKARSYGDFKMDGLIIPVFSQGLAWVDAQTYQILRLHTDLLAPLPEVRLEKETTEIDFAEVRFNRAVQGFWLPRDVTVTVDWNGKLLRNTHQYSDFKVFSVDATQRIGKPKDAGGEEKVEDVSSP